MAASQPFTKKDTQGIYRAASILINGGSVGSPAYREIEREYGATRSRFYALLLDLFLSGLDRERGTIINWPFRGAILDQPCGVKHAWSIMQEVYFRKIKADIDSMNKRRK